MKNIVDTEFKLVENKTVGVSDGIIDSSKKAVLQLPCPVKQNELGPSETNLVPRAIGRPRGKRGPYSKTVAKAKLIDSGVPIEEALKIVNPSAQLTKAAKDNAIKATQNYLLTQPEMVHLAKNAVKETLEMATVNGVQPTVSNRISAAQMVFDRAEPIIKQSEDVHHVIFHPVDLSKYELSR